MSEEKEKPKTVTLKITIPTKDTIVQAIKSMFPLVEVEIEEERKTKAEGDVYLPGQEGDVYLPGHPPKEKPYEPTDN